MPATWAIATSFRLQAQSATTKRAVSLLELGPFIGLTQISVSCRRGHPLASGLRTLTGTAALGEAYWRK